MSFIWDSISAVLSGSKTPTTPIHSSHNNDENAENKQQINENLYMFGDSDNVESTSAHTKRLEDEDENVEPSPPRMKLRSSKKRKFDDDNKPLNNPDEDISLDFNGYELRNRHIEGKVVSKNSPHRNGQYLYRGVPVETLAERKIRQCLRELKVECNNDDSKELCLIKLKKAIDHDDGISGNYSVIRSSHDSVRDSPSKSTNSERSNLKSSKSIKQRTVKKSEVKSPVDVRKSLRGKTPAKQTEHNSKTVIATVPKSLNAKASKTSLSQRLKELEMASKKKKSTTFLSANREISPKKNFPDESSQPYDMEARRDYRDGDYRKRTRNEKSLAAEHIDAASPILSKHSSSKSPISSSRENENSDYLNDENNQRVTRTTTLMAKLADEYGKTPMIDVKGNDEDKDHFEYDTDDITTSNAPMNNSSYSYWANDSSAPNTAVYNLEADNDSSAEAFVTESVLSSQVSIIDKGTEETHEEFPGYMKDTYVENDDNELDDNFPRSAISVDEIVDVDGEDSLSVDDGNDHVEISTVHVDELISNEVDNEVGSLKNSENFQLQENNEGYSEDIIKLSEDNFNRDSDTDEEEKNDNTDRMNDEMEEDARLVDDSNLEAGVEATSSAIDIQTESKTITADVDIDHSDSEGEDAEIGSSVREDADDDDYESDHESDESVESTSDNESVQREDTEIVENDSQLIQYDVMDEEQDDAYEDSEKSGPNETQSEYDDNTSVSVASSTLQYTGPVMPSFAATMSAFTASNQQNVNSTVNTIQSVEKKQSIIYIKDDDSDGPNDSLSDQNEANNDAMETPDQITTVQAPPSPTTVLVQATTDLAKNIVDKLTQRDKVLMVVTGAQTHADDQSMTRLSEHEYSLLFKLLEASKPLSLVTNVTSSESLQLTKTAEDATESSNGVDAATEIETSQPTKGVRWSDSDDANDKLGRESLDNELNPLASVDDSPRALWHGRRVSAGSTPYRYAMSNIDDDLSFTKKRALPENNETNELEPNRERKRVTIREDYKSVNYISTPIQNDFKKSDRSSIGHTPFYSNYASSPLQYYNAGSTPYRPKYEQKTLFEESLPVSSQGPIGVLSAASMQYPSATSVRYVPTFKDNSFRFSSGSSASSHRSILSRSSIVETKPLTFLQRRRLQKQSETVKETPTSTVAKRILETLNELTSPVTERQQAVKPILHSKESKTNDEKKERSHVTFMMSDSPVNTSSAREREAKSVAIDEKPVPALASKPIVSKVVNESALANLKYSFHPPTEVVTIEKDAMDIDSITTDGIVFTFSSPGTAEKRIQKSKDLKSVVLKEANISHEIKSTEKDPVNQSSKPAVNIWKMVTDKVKCQVCLVPNEKTATKCISCESPLNSGTAASSQDHSLQKSDNEKAVNTSSWGTIASSTATASKFVFGASTATTAVKDNQLSGSSGLVNSATQQPSTTATATSSTFTFGAKAPLASTGTNVSDAIGSFTTFGTKSSAFTPVTLSSDSLGKPVNESVVSKEAKSSVPSFGFTTVSSGQPLVTGGSSGFGLEASKKTTTLEDSSMSKSSTNTFTGFSLSSGYLGGKNVEEEPKTKSLKRSAENDDVQEPSKKYVSFSNESSSQQKPSSFFGSDASSTTFQFGSSAIKPVSDSLPKTSDQLGFTTAAFESIKPKEVSDQNTFTGPPVRLPTTSSMPSFGFSTQPENKSADAIDASSTAAPFVFGATKSKPVESGQSIATLKESSGFSLTGQAEKQSTPSLVFGAPFATATLGTNNASSSFQFGKSNTSTTTAPTTMITNSVPDSPGSTMDTSEVIATPAVSNQLPMTSFGFPSAPSTQPFTFGASGSNNTATTSFGQPSSITTSFGGFGTIPPQLSSNPFGSTGSGLSLGTQSSSVPTAQPLFGSPSGGLGSNLSTPFSSTVGAFSNNPSNIAASSTGFNIGQTDSTRKIVKAKRPQK